MHAMHMSGLCLFEDVVQVCVFLTTSFFFRNFFLFFLFRSVAKVPRGLRRAIGKEDGLMRQFYQREIARSKYSLKRKDQRMRVRMHMHTHPDVVR